MSNDSGPGHRRPTPDYATEVRSSDGVLVGAGVQFNLFARDEDSSLRLTRLGLLAAVLVVLLAASSVFAAAVALTGKNDALGPPEILLEPSGLQGANPFMPTPPAVHRPDGAQPVVELPSSTGSAAARPYSGDLPGLYSAPRGQVLTDRDEIAEFYATHPDEARTAAGVLSADTALTWSGGKHLSGSDLVRYLRELTPALLRVDLRVTNHALVAGRAVAQQSILQAGTAILVDQRGTPRFRSLGGSPLTLPTALPNAPDFAGEPWPGFDVERVCAVSPSAAALSRLVLIDSGTGLPFERAVGSVGGEDIDHADWGGAPPPPTSTSPPAARPTSAAPATTRASAPAGPLDLSGSWVMQSSSPTSGGTTLIGTMRRTAQGFAYHREETVATSLFTWDCTLPDRLGATVTMTCRNGGTVDGQTYAADWSCEGRLVTIAWGAVTKFRFDGTCAPPVDSYDPFAITLAPQ
ncbi:DUF6777 domain-containing protein [Nocardia sp. NPDC048505]|uniref:DUF6777 domain-containing protein n=1 Tax=unclassified Nocardia TaxID=2637762 RepID=UPI0034103471